MFMAIIVSNSLPDPPEPAGDSVSSYFVFLTKRR